MMPAMWSSGPLAAYGETHAHAGSVQNAENSGSTGGRGELGATYAGLKAMRGVQRMTTALSFEKGC